MIGVVVRTLARHPRDVKRHFCPIARIVTLRHHCDATASLPNTVHGSDLWLPVHLPLITCLTLSWDSIHWQPSQTSVLSTPTMSDIQCVTSVSILGVTISNRLFVDEHVPQKYNIILLWHIQSVISKCPQSMHAPITVWAVMHLRSSTSRLCSLSYFMLPSHGGVAPLRLTSNGLKHSSWPLGVATCGRYWRWTPQCCDGELSSRATSHVTWPYLSSGRQMLWWSGYCPALSTQISAGTSASKIR